MTYELLHNLPFKCTEQLFTFSKGICYEDESLTNEVHFSTPKTFLKLFTWVTLQN